MYSCISFGKLRKWLIEGVEKEIEEERDEKVNTIPYMNILYHPDTLTGTPTAVDKIFQNLLLQ